MQVREYNSVEELAPLRDAWRRLHEQTPQASFFQSLDWLEVYWRHHGARQRLRVLALEDRDATTGILPLVVRRERTKLGSLRFLTYPLDYWGPFTARLAQIPTPSGRPGSTTCARRLEIGTCLSPAGSAVNKMTAAGSSDCCAVPACSPLSQRLILPR